MLARLGDWVDRHERKALGALIAFYLAVVLAQANVKLVWADELITFYIARQPGLTGIWNALKAGTDPNPPLMHVMVKASTAVFGGNALGMRLPSILCVLLAMVAMWWMLRRWVRPVFALGGVLAFMGSRGFDYAYDARSYAPMMGFAMASLALWMLASDLAGWRRICALAGMATALALGVSANYYCVLASFPIAVGELAGRRWRAATWVAMAVGSLPLFVYLPLIRHNIVEFGPHAWNRPQVSMIAMSYLELVEGIFWPVLGLAVWVWLKRKKTNTEGREVSRNWAEMAAVGGLLIYPFLGFAVAVGGAGMISPRCVAPVCCGIGFAAGLLGQAAFGRSARAGMGLVLGLIFWVTVREGFCAGVLLEQRRGFFALRDDVAKARTGFTLIADSSFVLPLRFYSSSEVNGLMWFPIDFDAIHRDEKEDSGEQNLWAGRNGVFWLRVVPMSGMPFGHNPGSRTQCLSDMTVIARPDGWLSRELKKRGFLLSVVGDTADWYRVGGIFTPMAHPETRRLLAQQNCTNM